MSGKSVNFIIAGMRANTTYNLVHQVQSGFSFSFPNAPLQFTTGSIPVSVSLPTMRITGNPTTQEGVILESAIRPNTLPMAFDTSGHVIWYNYPPAPGGINFLFQPLNGGTMMLGLTNAQGTQGDMLQEIDLLGNVLRETNITRVSEQLSSPPFNIMNSSIPNRIASFDHDAIALPNGNIAAISIFEQHADQGQGQVDVLGDLVLVLDRNFQLVWAWNAFAHLNVKRKATLPNGDICANAGPGCPVLKLLPPGQSFASDWLHANSLGFTGDGNLLLSLRNQDWVIKIHYANATGTANGDVLWRFGNQGDFNLVGGGQWFSHQHDASLKGTTLSLFDNANADETNFGGSRGLVFTINEEAKTADMVHEALMHTFSSIVGTAQTLLNGNLWFLAGAPPPLNGPTSRAIEFRSGSMATPVAQFDTNSSNYRSFRMKDLYTP